LYRAKIGPCRALVRAKVGPCGPLSVTRHWPTILLLVGRYWTRCRSWYPTDPSTGPLSCRRRPEECCRRGSVVANGGWMEAERSSSWPRSARRRTGTMTGSSGSEQKRRRVACDGEDA
ncbi:hypothetical protein Droror1_Dr00020340, partial [Drosera rotundifolia]